jgi:hypothetical protein
MASAHLLRLSFIIVKLLNCDTITSALLFIFEFTNDS